MIQLCFLRQVYFAVILFYQGANYGLTFEYHKILNHASFLANGTIFPNDLPDPLFLCLYYCNLIYDHSLSFENHFLTVLYLTCFIQDLLVSLCMIPNNI